ncbi:ketol-acid reductoisomerase [Crocinitomicaceae bacterium]|nr:ketol-acid reductoisomerase [Crocinitomicaceae bacterium]
MKNYYNALPRQNQLEQLGKCDFLEAGEFTEGVQALLGKNIVIVGCGAQGLNQGLNMRDSGLNISYALRKSAIDEQRPSYKNATDNDFHVGTYEEVIPTADLVINLTPDKQHTSVVRAVMPLMKKGATLSYSHGFNIVEEGMQIREDITVIMMAPKSPGSEVREEYKRGFGVPTLIAVHPDNDPEGKGLERAKAYALATGGDRAGVLLSSFVAEVKSDLMGEQTILCGVLQTASVLLFDKMVQEGRDPAFSAKLIQNGWEVITEALKQGGITEMMDRLSEPAQLKASETSERLKVLMTPLFEHHMADILSGKFSERMMKDWQNEDAALLTWRYESSQTPFEMTEGSTTDFPSQFYFEHGTLMVAFVKSGVELAFETMVANGIKEESAYYESLHELPLIANTIARKKLYEMNRIISDTAEYGCYLFDHACKPLLRDFVMQLDASLIGEVIHGSRHQIQFEIQALHEQVANHPIELVGKKLRASMTAMQHLITD